MSGFPHCSFLMVSDTAGAGYGAGCSLVVLLLLLLLSVDGHPAQTSYRSSSPFCSSLLSTEVMPPLSLSYTFWLCRFSRNLLRTLKGHKGMKRISLTEPLSLYWSRSEPRRTPSPSVSSVDVRGRSWHNKPSQRLVGGLVQNPIQHLETA